MRPTAVARGARTRLPRNEVNKTIDDVLQYIKSGSFMATLDLQSAYQAVPLHPDKRASFGIRWDFGQGDVTLCDNFLGFGTKVAPFIFDRMTDSISSRMWNCGFMCFNYLNDFIVIADTYEQSKQAQVY